MIETQRLSETQRVDGVIRRHDLDCNEPTLGFLQNDLARRKNRVPDAVKRNLENVAARVKGDAEQRQPTCLETVA